MKRSAITLLELLVSNTLFLLALIICSQLAITSIRSRSQSLDKNTAFKAQITLIHQLQIDLKEAHKFYSPDLYDFALYQPGVNGQALVLCPDDKEGKPQVLGWVAQGNILKRTIYKPDFNPLLTATHLPSPQYHQLHCDGIGNFTIQMQPIGQNYGCKLLRIQLDCLKPALQKIQILEYLQL